MTVMGRRGRWGLIFGDPGRRWWLAPRRWFGFGLRGFGRDNHGGLGCDRDV